MKKLVIVGLMMVLSGGFAMAEMDEVKKGFYIEGQVSAMIPTEDGLQTGVYSNGRLGYRFNDYMGLEVESGYANISEDPDVVDYDLIPLLLNARLHPIKGEKFDPYLVGGLGVLFVDVNVDEEGVVDEASALLGVDLSAFNTSVSVDADADEAFAGQIGIGALYHFNDNIAAFLEVRGFFAQTDVHVKEIVTSDVGSAKTEIDDEMKFHSVVVGGGLRIKF
ncbi:MAG: outer membrane beta-barrel protein [Chlamydiae bacterium]|nr:outer membrane beta-barrel protein [Chlamydiota bacterium]MBI3265669.1 outer membrane beta-barrel protein [Chlamydiota bacterium]